jgi:hypothetical protein
LPIQIIEPPFAEVVLKLFIGEEGFFLRISYFTTIGVHPRGKFLGMLRHFLYCLSTCLVAQDILSRSIPICRTNVPNVITSCPDFAFVASINQFFRTSPLSVAAELRRSYSFLQFYQ